MNIFKSAEGARLPPGKPDKHRGERADAPKNCIADAGVGHSTPHSAIHRQVDGKDDAEKDDKEVKLNLHLRSPIVRVISRFPYELFCLLSRQRDDTTLIFRHVSKPQREMWVDRRAY